MFEHFFYLEYYEQRKMKLDGNTGHTYKKKTTHLYINKFLKKTQQRQILINTMSI